MRASVLFTHSLISLQTQADGLAEYPDVPMPPTTHSVLVIDSFPDTAENIAQVLTLNAIPARVAHGRREALVAARNWSPTAVLLDIPLVDGDGYELIRTLCETLGYRPLVVVITGRTGYEDRSRAAEVDYHLLKPVGASDLVDLLRLHAVDPQPLSV